MAKKKRRNYSATDTTLINLRALKKRVAALEKQMRTVVRAINSRL